MIRVLLNRQHFRALVAGKQVRGMTADAPGVEFEIALDLDREGDARQMTDYSDPPQAAEFLKGPLMTSPGPQR